MAISANAIHRPRREVSSTKGKKGPDISPSGPFTSAKFETYSTVTLTGVEASRLTTTSNSLAPGLNGGFLGKRETGAGHLGTCGHTHGAYRSGIVVLFCFHCLEVSAGDAIVPAQSILIKHAPEIPKASGERGKKRCQHAPAATAAIE